MFVNAQWLVNSIKYLWCVYRIMRRARGNCGVIAGLCCLDEHSRSI